MSKPETFHATTIVSVRRHGRVVIGGDGQVTLGNTVMKSNARKVRRLGRGDVLAAVKALRALGVEFVETPAAHTEQRGAITKTYLGSVVFELVHSERAGG